MALQAYLDDSRSENGNGTFVLAGYIARADRWAAFAKEWEELLPFVPLDSKNQRNFKMSLMAMNDERMERVPPFFKVIEKHVLASISVRIDVKDLQVAKRRIVFPDCDIDFGYIDKPYLFTIRALYDQFHIHKLQWSNFMPTMNQSILFLMMIPIKPRYSPNGLDI